MEPNVGPFLLHEWPFQSVIVFFQIMEGFFCVFAFLCLSLSCFLVVDATKILGFLTQGEGLYLLTWFQQPTTFASWQALQITKGSKERLFSYT